MNPAEVNIVEIDNPKGITLDDEEVQQYNINKKFRRLQILENMVLEINRLREREAEEMNQRKFRSVEYQRQLVMEKLAKKIDNSTCILGNDAERFYRIWDTLVKNEEESYDFVAKTLLCLASGKTEKTDMNEIGILEGEEQDRCSVKEEQVTENLNTYTKSDPEDGQTETSLNEEIDVKESRPKSRLRKVSASPAPGSSMNIAEKKEDPPKHMKPILKSEIETMDSTGAKLDLPSDEEDLSYDSIFTSDDSTKEQEGEYREEETRNKSRTGINSSTSTPKRFTPPVGLLYEHSSSRQSFYSVADPIIPEISDIIEEGEKEQNEDDLSALDQSAIEEYSESNEKIGTSEEKSAEVNPEQAQEDRLIQPLDVASSSREQSPVCTVMNESEEKDTVDETSARVVVMPDNPVQEEGFERAEIRPEIKCEEQRPVDSRVGEEEKGTAHPVKPPDHNPTLSMKRDVVNKPEVVPSDFTDYRSRTKTVNSQATDSSVFYDEADHQENGEETDAKRNEPLIIHNKVNFIARNKMMLKKKMSKQTMVKPTIETSKKLLRYDTALTDPSMTEIRSDETSLHPQLSKVDI